VNPILIAFLGVLIVPLFLASWRLSLAGLAVQGLLMAWIGYEQHPALDSVGAWIQVIDLVAVRGLAAPLALYAVLRGQGATPRSDVIPPNLMSWTLAIGFVFVAFRFADLLVPADDLEHSFVAAAGAGVLLGLLVLSTQIGPFSQMVGALRIENGIAMFELSGHRDPAMQLAQLVILVATILLFRWYLKTLPRATVAKISAVEGMHP
jgi:hydrogenase-4 component E